MLLADLKKKYAGYEKKYKLPSFDALNELFEIDRIRRDRDCFMRVVRKAVMAKVVNSMGFVEMLLNPVQAPRIYYSYLKSMSAEDKKLLDGVYEVLAGLSLESISLEVEYDEKKEAALVVRAYTHWLKSAPALHTIMEHIRHPKESVAKEKTYFG